MSAVKSAVRLPRGRPSKADAAQIDLRVLDAAWDVFLEKGYDLATMEQVAERARITKTTLYLRHRDKASLLKATVHDRMGRWSRINRRDGWIVGDTLEERLVCLARNVLKAADNPELLATTRLTQSTVGEAGRIARELDRFIREPIIEEVTGEIAEYSHIEGFSVRDPKAIARFFFAMLESVTDRYADGYADPLRQEAVARQVVAVLFSGRSAW